MGDSEPDAHKDDNTLHKVRVDSFYLAKYPVTQALWLEVMKGENPSRFEGADRPVEQVSWDDAQKFIKKLNQKAKYPRYRLPTEAEWEFAARGGVHRKGYLYAGSDKLSEVGWYEGNNGERTVPVGQLLSNELGLYDMSGNVWEWCEDWYGAKYYQQCLQRGLEENPIGPDTGTTRVVRGGSWIYDARNCRVAYRSNFLSPEDRNVNIGFRLLFVPSQEDGHSGIPVS